MEIEYEERMQHLSQSDPTGADGGASRGSTEGPGEASGRVPAVHRRTAAVPGNAPSAATARRCRCATPLLCLPRRKSRHSLAAFEKPEPCMERRLVRRGPGCFSPRWFCACKPRDPGG